MKLEQSQTPHSLRKRHVTLLGYPRIFGMHGILRIGVQGNDPRSCTGSIIFPVLPVAGPKLTTGYHAGGILWRPHGVPTKLKAACPLGQASIHKQAVVDASVGQPSSEHSRLAPQLLLMLYPLVQRAEGGACQKPRKRSSEAEELHGVSPARRAPDNPNRT